MRPLSRKKAASSGAIVVSIGMYRCFEDATSSSSWVGSVGTWSQTRFEDEKSRSSRA